MDRFEEFAERLTLDMAVLRPTPEGRRQYLANALRDAHRRGVEDERDRVIAEVLRLLESRRQQAMNAPRFGEAQREREDVRAHELVHVIAAVKKLGEVG